MSELRDIALILCGAAVILFWIVLLAGWAVAGEDPGDEETDDA